MASTLYQEIQAKAEARTLRDTITRILTLRLGSLESAVRERIQALDDAEALKRWYEEALLLVDAESARRLAERLKQWS